MAAFLDICRFLPTAGGTTDWTYAAAVQGYQSPAAAGAANGRLYKYRAESADLTQWEIGEGAYNSSTAVLTRATVLFNSLGTGTAAGQSGAGAKINFSAAPQVAVVALKEDLVAIEEANSFTTAQQAQARSNIAAAATPGIWTRTVLTSGAGTYTLKTGCRALLVRMVGGGGGGGGGIGSSAGGNGSIGSATTFGSLTAGGGGPGSTGGSSPQSGGTSSGGDVTIDGSRSWSGFGTGATTAIYQGVNGMASAFGSGGAGGWPGAAGSAATVPGAGGGGGGGTGGAGQTAGGGGGGGGYVEKLISSPAASYAYSVGAGGAGGSAGGGGTATSGGAGASGIIIIDEYY
ncbi:hypothetical protein [Bradyrhizobium sp. HKCCYLR20261]|uniref:hypothetical protein n=1 Tax=Bradyrhizobium sp. HKCCYLR20261 TaxID=3420760 RepID=UPI003EB8742E